MLFFFSADHHVAQIHAAMEECGRQFVEALMRVSDALFAQYDALVTIDDVLPGSESWLFIGYFVR